MSSYEKHVHILNQLNINVKKKLLIVHIFLDIPEKYDILLHMNDMTPTQKIRQHESELPQYIAEAIQIIGSVRKLASIAGVSERSVYAWKNGERFPNRNNINKISEYLEGLANNPYQLETPSPLRCLRESLAKPYQNAPATGLHTAPHDTLSSKIMSPDSVPHDSLPHNSLSQESLTRESSINDTLGSNVVGSAFLGKTPKQEYLSQSQIYIANEQDQRPRPNTANISHTTSSPSPSIADEFVFIEKAEAKPSAGGGSLETSAECENTYAFRLDWILQKTHSSSGLRIMEVAGRSMENTLHSGDLILIDEQDKRLVEDRIYVLRVHDEIYIKRFSKTPGYYHFRGDNRDLAYQDITINLQTEDLDWCIIGRTIWAGKEL